MQLLNKGLKAPVASRPQQRSNVALPLRSRAKVVKAMAAAKQGEGAREGGAGADAKTQEKFLNFIKSEVGGMVEEGGRDSGLRFFRATI